jgi:adenine deaminase
MKPHMDKTDNDRMPWRVSLGAEPPDVVVTRCTVFNAFTREFVEGQSIWIKDGLIAYAGPDHDFLKGERTRIVDAAGMVVLPGLLEGHTHVATRCGIEEFVRHVIPSGVTTVITETIELASVTGKAGIEHLVKGLEDQPIRFYYTLPPLCGVTEAVEVMAPANEELLPLLQDPRCLGVGEVYWANMLAEGRQGERVRELAKMALGLGKRVEGHTAGASGRKLQAYTALGISSCHEPIAEQEVWDRLRLGYWVMIREGAIRKELEAIQGLFKREIDFRRLILATDSMDPEGFLTEGYLDASLKTAMALGVEPGVAYQMVTINVAEHFRLDHLLGALGPGKAADLVLTPSPREYSPQLVMCDGRILFQDGKLLASPRRASFPEEMFHMVKVADLPALSLPKKGKVRAMELVTRLVTRERIIDLDDREDAKDLLMLLAMDRTGGGGAFMGLLKGFGLERGACGTTMCWDTVDLFVVGKDARSMARVVGRLKELGGGAAFAIGDEVVAEFPAPLCGVVSLKPMEAIREEIRRLEDALMANGVPWEKSLLTLDILGTAAIPHMRITHHGYVRLRDRALLPLEA